ncbi:MAG: glycosyltransferase family 4 protein [Clostridiales bacterium]|nr:glycosyltransferase family 4 protein [Clostridiales bacterium]
MKKRVLILANNAVGLYNFRFELICELFKQGLEVHFAVPETIEDKKVQLIIDAGAKYLHTPLNRRGTNPFEDLKLIMQYKKVMKTINPDVVLTFTIKPNIYGTYVASKFNKPVIMNVTGIGSSLVSGNLKKVVKNLYKHACEKADIVFFENEDNRCFFIHNKIVNYKKTVLLPGAGVNINKYRPVEKRYKSDKIKFLFIGRIMKEKGIEEYLEAANNITKKYTNTEFQILGPFEEKQYETLILKNKNSNIKYLGVSDDVRNEIKEIDCIVHPSYHEGMSNVLLEGAAMGKPLIASNIPGCKEIIEDGHNGYLFQVKSVKSLEEKLEKFINLNDHAKELMGKNSRNKVLKEFDRKIVIDKYIKAINTVLKEGNKNESI